MSTGVQNPLAALVVKTKDVPTVYCNHANPSVSFNDIRVYLSEVIPEELTALVPDKPSPIKPHVESRICVVCSPEFAKAMAESLLKAVGKYEELFGQLRPSPNQEELNKKLLSPAQ
jgi:hypothetical protein